MSPEPDSMELAAKICREAGFALTLQRRAVLEALARRSDHPSADEVHRSLDPRFEAVSRATVYRTLENLAAHGVIRRVCHPGAAIRYEIRTGRHHHLVCDRCGRIEDFEHASLDGLTIPNLSRRGFRLRDFSVHLRGLCAACRQGEAPAARPRKPLPRSDP